MNAHLLFRDRTCTPSAIDERLRADLELDSIFDSMAAGDPFILKTVLSVFSADNICSDKKEILYRQSVTRDCMEHSDKIREFYQIVTRLVKMDRDTYLSVSHKKAKYMLDVAVKVMTSVNDPLKQLHHFAADLLPVCHSDGMRDLLTGLLFLFDPEKLSELKAFMSDMSTADGITAVGVLGKHLRAGSYHPCRPEKERKKGIFGFLHKDRNEQEFDVDMSDPESSPALSRLRDAMAARSASVVVRARNELFDFLAELREELAFYVGCANLRDDLKKLNIPCHFPVIYDHDQAEDKAAYFHTTDLYNLSFSLQEQKSAVPNSFSFHSDNIIMITGSNQGGKTTFLRSLGQALLLGAAGIFCAAEDFCMAPGKVYTHFIREEDKTLKSGKLDEELLRMSDIINQIHPGDWLLLNESFASTNEEEGSEIALEIITALSDQGIFIAYVTHFDHLVRLLKEQRPDCVLYLNALRGDSGIRTYQLKTGEPLVRGYGEDLYHEIFDD